MISTLRCATILLLILQAVDVRGEPYYGKEIGSFANVNHGVSGTVYAVDESTIMIRDFNFDGMAPATFFWVGTTNLPSAMGQELYIDARQIGLEQNVNAVLVVSMPTGKKTTDFKWLSVWCRSAEANFGEVFIPTDFVLPAAHDFGPLVGVAHDVNADRVWILDSNTIRFENLRYDGNGPDAYFWAGTTTTPDYNGMRLTWRVGNNQVIHRAFTGEDVTVTIPQPLTIYDLKYVGLWCVQFTQDFGHLQIDTAVLNVPAVVSRDQPEYYGKLVGEFATLAHDVAGKVYALDQTRIMVRDFKYDGMGPDAFLWVGTTNLPSTQGTPLYLDSRQEKLGAYDNGVLVVELPWGTKITDYMWLSVWCRMATANFGHLTIPPGLKLPDQHNLGPMPTIAHDAAADSVIIVDSKTFLFVNFTYDGNGPDTFFWAGPTVTPDETGFPLKWTRGNNQILDRAFTGENVTAQLPPGTSVFDIAHVGVWCHQARADFAHVEFNAQFLNVPAYLGMGDMEVLPNCAVMEEDMFQASWLLTGDSILVRLSGRVSKGQYLAFGLSGLETRTLMDGSDVAVAWEKQDGSIKVEDYNLQSKQQCTVDGSSGQMIGACEDTATGGADNVDFVAYSDISGIKHFTYSRLLVTGDSVDKNWPIDREVYISWAMGSINPSGRVAKHTKAPLGDVKINFGGAPSTCPAFTAADVPPVTLPAWPKQVLRDKQSFIVEIGQNGGQRGYESLTGQVGWGIAWYVNRKLIPEIYVVRGKVYTFTVRGGEDPIQSAKYHPFYITNDTMGGYAQQTPEEQQDVVIYSGPHTGPYCEWKVRQPGISPDDFNTFDEYRENLQLDCKDPSKSGTTFSWMPDENTPDLVYYQCYTHRFLGWKIHVINDEGGTSAGAPLYGSLATLGILLAASRWIC